MGSMGWGDVREKGLIWLTGNLSYLGDLWLILEICGLID
jgi:hypothetical protein